MSGLTTTQHSALGELNRRGSLRPSSRAWSKYDGRRTFARRTLQALVDAGFAEWRLAVRGTRNGPVTYDGFITPIESSGEDSVPSEDRFYAIGLPVCFTVKADGTITIDVDLAEADDIDEDDDAYGRYGREQVDADRARVSAAVATIQNVLSTTLKA